MEHLIPRDDAQSLLRRSTAQVQTLLERLPVSSDTLIPHMEWSVGELGAHLVQSAEVAVQLVDGVPSPYDRFDRIAEINDRFLDEKDERDLRVLSGQYRRAVSELDRKFRALPDDARVPFHQGVVFSPAQAMAMYSGETLVHAWDLSAVTGRPIAIEPVDARMILYAVATILPKAVDEDAARGFTGTYELQIRDGACLRLHFEDGEMFVSDVEPGGPADCRILADAPAFLLTGYGRGSQVAPIVTGKVLAWGRKPWLAGTFTNLVRSP